MKIGPTGSGGLLQRMVRRVAGWFGSARPPAAGPTPVDVDAARALVSDSDLTRSGADLSYGVLSFDSSRIDGRVDYAVEDGDLPIMRRIYRCGVSPLVGVEELPRHRGWWRVAHAVCSEVADGQCLLFADYCLPTVERAEWSLSQCGPDGFKWEKLTPREILCAGRVRIGDADRRVEIAARDSHEAEQLREAIRPGLRKEGWTFDLGHALRRIEFEDRQRGCEINNLSDRDHPMAIVTGPANLSPATYRYVTVRLPDGQIELRVKLRGPQDKAKRFPSSYYDDWRLFFAPDERFVDGGNLQSRWLGDQIQEIVLSGSSQPGWHCHEIDSEADRSYTMTLLRAVLGPQLKTTVDQ